MKIIRRENRILFWGRLLLVALTLIFVTRSRFAQKRVSEFVAMPQKKDGVEALPIANEFTQSKSAAINSVEAVSVVVDRAIELSQKALMTRSENREMQGILSSEIVITEVFKSLRETPMIVTHEMVKNRMRSIDVLRSYLEWKENPLRAKILNQISEYLKLRVPNSEDKSIRKVWVGDRIEIFNLFREQDPHRAEVVKADAGDSLGAVYEYAQNWQDGTNAVPNNKEGAR